MTGLITHMVTFVHVHDTDVDFEIAKGCRELFHWCHDSLYWAYLAYKIFPKAIPSQDSIFSKHFEAHLVNDDVWYELITSQCSCLDTLCSLTEGSDWNATVSRARITKR